jgi:hypothetical protein
MARSRTRLNHNIDIFNISMADFLERDHITLHIGLNQCALTKVERVGNEI